MKKVVYKMLMIIFCLVFIVSSIYTIISSFTLTKMDVIEQILDGIIKWIIPPISFILFGLFYILNEMDNDKK